MLIGILTGGLGRGATRFPKPLSTRRHSGTLAQAKADCSSRFSARSHAKRSRPACSVSSLQLVGNELLEQRQDRLVFAESKACERVCDSRVRGSEERLAQNKILFRSVNERINQLSDRWHNALSLICECADPTCINSITLDRSQYEQLRENPRHFAVLPGHEIPEIETVVERHTGYLVVEKHEETHERVETADPRS